MLKNFKYVVIATYKQNGKCYYKSEKAIQKLSTKVNSKLLLLTE
jgi:hypothetical protein